MSRGFGKKFFVILHKVFGVKFVGFVYIAQIPPAQSAAGGPQKEGGLLPPLFPNEFARLLAGHNRLSNIGRSQMVSSALNRHIARVEVDGVYRATFKSYPKRIHD